MSPNEVHEICEAAEREWRDRIGRIIAEAEERMWKRLEAAAARAEAEEQR